MAESSKIFIRNRAIGYVSNHVPAVTRYIKLRKDNVIVTCVGKSFHTYDKNQLKLLAVSDPCEDEITCLAADSRRTYTAAGSKVQAWIRGTILNKTYPGHQEPVHLLLPFGLHLLSVDDANVLRVWDRNKEEVFLEINFDVNSFKITAINHPSTYINKILLGSEQGGLQLWNIKTSNLVHSFKGWDSCVMCLEQTPALDVTAIGLRSGKIILHNIKYDETLMDFSQDWGPVLCLSFRTDGPTIMASGTTMGHIVLWDLEEKRVSSQILDAHCGPVSSCHFLPNEPLLVSSSQDNSLKMWIFDKTDSSGRLLRQREGHGAQPTFIRFHGNNGYYIMSSGTDSSLRVFSLVNETYNYSMGKASFNKKAAKKKKDIAEKLLMPPIVEFTSETTRDKEWDSIAAVHTGLPLVTTWSFDKRKMGDLRLIPEKFSKETRASLNVTATCVALTMCGNFALVGYSTGNVERFNVQSGMHRCQYGDPVAHKGSSIRGVLSDPLNQSVMSADGKGQIKFWPFKPDRNSTICKKPLVKIRLNDGISFVRSQKDSSLIALAMEDFSIAVIDFSTRKLVRRLSGHKGHITDITFSPDCRWIVSSSVDSSIRVWDLPTACLIDMFKVDSVCTSLALSPSGHMLATIHVDNLGIYLWYNKSLYTSLNLKPLDPTGNIPSLSLPSSRGAEAPVALTNEEEIMDDEETEEECIDQIQGLITLSGLPSSRWLNLLDIELIRKRNKAKAKLNVVEKAPFFLPTVASSRDIQFDFAALPDSTDSVDKIRLENIHSLSAFSTLLENSKEKENYAHIVEKLKLMNPSMIDFEINSIGFDAVRSDVLLAQFMKTIGYMLKTNKDFELAQSYLSLFLKFHGRTIASNPELKQILDQIESKQKESWDIIQSDVMYLLSVIDGLKI